MADVERQLAQRLHSVRMEEHAALAAQTANLFDGLNHAGFVVGRHDRDQNGAAAESSFEFIEIDQPVLADVKIGDATSAFFQMPAAVENGLVLCDRGDDVVAALAVRIGNSDNGQIVAFRGAGGEYDLLRRSANGCRNLPAGGLDRRGCFPSESVAV